MPDEPRKKVITVNVYGIPTDNASALAGAEAWVKRGPMLNRRARLRRALRRLLKGLR